MTTAPAILPPLPAPPPAASQHKTLRRIFLTLFLRGRGARGLQRQTAPKSVTRKLSVTLFFYAAVGSFTFAFIRQPVFALSVYLHSMTFAFLGMFVAASAGEILFNKEEPDILLHRPVTASALLWAKIRVLIEVSLYLAAAFNLVGFVVGVYAQGGGWRFPLIHAVSTFLEALFCAGFVVMIYQLCLRWFGRERLDGLMTAAQVMVAIAAVLVGQIVPQLIPHMHSLSHFTADSWWIALLPPAWFAGFDDALAGSAAATSIILGALSVLATAAVTYLAFAKLAGDYEAGVQSLSETAATRPRKPATRRRIDLLADAAPLRWWLRDPVERAAFRLTAAYLLRDRDTKLRVYPGIAPLLAMPIVMLVQGHGTGPFGIGFCGVFIGLMPLFGLNILQYSQQWLASDIFRAAPLPGPGKICHGARRAALLILGLPLVLAFILIVQLIYHDRTQLLLLLPGIIALPVYALVPHLGGRAVPLSTPTEESKSASRGLNLIAAMVVSMALSGIAVWSQSAGYFRYFLLIEFAVCLAIYFPMRHTITIACWSQIE